MFQLDLLVRRRNGRAERLGQSGIPGVIDLPRVARELYGTARVLRVFTFEQRSLSRDEVIDVISATRNVRGEKGELSAPGSKEPGDGGV